MATINELREKPAQDLQAHLVELHKEQFALRMQKATGQLGQPHNIKRVRREIAQTMTLLTQKK